ASRMAALLAAEGRAATVGTRAPGDEADDDGTPPVGLAVEPYLDALFGGDRDAGREVFARASLNCGKCHAVDEWGRQVVGPNLQGVGRRLSRLQLLESICAPNRRIAPGFGSELLFLAGAGPLACRVLEEGDDGQLKVTDAEGDLRLLDAADVEFRKPALSAMPEGLAQGATREDMRDLLEYLAGL
ncbi:MAG: c-type cytochrome, partial [Planctomycetes bacterium]|nr:c-type cytochrome [Planctomycetota bacterium]